MLNLKQIFDDIYIIIAKKQSFFEFILNLTFILIVLIIIVILYWDNINRNIISKGRCKININNSDVTFNVNIKKKADNTNLVNISYDNSSEHKVKLDCICPAGNTPNNFNVPVWIPEENKVRNLQKICYCDNNYATSDSAGVNNATTSSIDNTKVTLEGDAFLKDYYNGLLDSYSSGITSFQPINFSKYAPV